MTPKTLRKELREIIFDLLELAYQDNPPTEEARAYNREQADKIADAVREVRGIAMAAPKSLDWLLASGASSEDIAAVNAKDEAERALLFFYESKMGYGTTLDWWGKNDDLVALRKFLITKTEGEIETFCTWCKRQYSKFRPEDAARFPRNVMIFWPMAFEEKTEKAQDKGHWL